MVALLETERAPPADMPEPSAELVLFRVFAEAYMAAVPPKEARRFMKRAEELIALYEAGGDVLPLRAPPQIAVVQSKRRQAATWFRAVMPAILNRV